MTPDQLGYPEGSYELIPCSACGQPIEARGNWTRSGGTFRHDACPPPVEAAGFLIPPPLLEEMQRDYGPSPVKADREQPAARYTAVTLISQELLDDCAGDWLGKALRGEIEPRPPVKPPWHRCVFCWLISLLPGHDRCDHGRLSCDDCFDDYR
jgi:hypothetical protein